MHVFGENAGGFVEETCDFRLRTGIFGRKKCDLGVKCGISEVNIRDSRVINGIFRVKMRVLGVKFSKRKCLLFGAKSDIFEE